MRTARSNIVLSVAASYHRSVLPTLRCGKQGQELDQDLSRFSMRFVVTLQDMAVVVISATE
jgi:hypothetical protein